MLKDGELTAQALRQILSAQNIEVDFTVDKTGTTTIDKMFKTFDSSLFDTSFVKKQQEAEARKKRLKDLKDEIERYHEINEALEDTENQLDAISKAKDRAFGPDKLKYMD
jgi:histidyl-tRNA synthetase